MKRAALISVIVGTALAIVPAGLAAEVSDGGGTSGTVQSSTMAPTSYDQAMQQYGSTTGVTPLSQIDPAIQAVLVRNASRQTARTDTNTPLSQLDPAIRAVVLRNRTTQSVPLTGKALADFYDTGAVVTSKPVSDTVAFEGTPDILGGNGTTPATSGDSSSINWNALGPAIALGLVLIAMTATAVTRRRHQLSV